MIDFTHPYLTLPLISAFGVITSLAGIAVIEGIMKREETDEKVHFLATGKGLFTLLSVVFGLWLLPLVLLFWEEPKGVGEAGDMFGGVTALFSGLAFAGLISTIYLQRHELTQTREVFRRQKFEQLFFQLLKLFRDYVDQSSFNYREINGGGGENRVCEGAELLNKLADEVWVGGRFQGKDLDDYKRKVLGPWAVWYYRHSEVFLGPYFRMLWNVIRLIDQENTLTDDEKLAFSQYVRATLSPSEVVLIAMYGLSEMGEDAGRNFVPTYELAKYLRPRDAERYPFLVLAEEYGKPAYGTRYDVLRSEAVRGLPAHLRDAV